VKGAIAIALKEMVIQHGGAEKWQQVLQASGISKEPMLFPISDVDDSLTLKIFENACRALGMSLPQGCEAFGEYWMTVYAPKHYPVYLKSAKNAREFLLKMDSVHETLTKTTPNAHPPRFKYSWRDERTLIMHYESARGLVDLVVGLVKGVGKAYGERLQVTKLGANQVQVTFLS